MCGSVCLCLLVTTASPAEMAEPIETSFGTWTRVQGTQGTTRAVYAVIDTHSMRSQTAQERSFLIVLAGNWYDAFGRCVY